MTLSFAALLVVQAATPAPQTAEILAGYAAKMICSTVFVSHRDPAAALRQDLARSAAAAYRVDSATRAVVASMGGAARRAVFRDGLGCTLRPDTLSVPAAAWKSRPWPPRATGLWPAGERVDTVHVPAGVNRALLGRALDSAFAEPGPTGPRRTRAVVVAWNGRIVAERYAEGFDAAMPQIGWSVTKSVTNALVGILVKAGKLDVGRPVQAPEWQATPNDPRAAITLDDLLRISSGLTFDETYGGKVSDVARDLFVVADAGAYAASLPLEHPIGSRWAYASGSTNIVSREIRRVIGNDSAYLGFPRRALFEPLGMRSAVLEPDPSGTFVGSSFMYATARDWARFGQFYLNDGVWNSVRILPEGWVAYSTRPSRADSTGGYGAYIWINAGDAAGKRPLPKLPSDAFFFRGYDRQDIAVVPSHCLVAVRLGQTPGRDWDLEGFLVNVMAALPPGSGCRR